MLQTWVLVCYFDRHFSSIWREQLGHGESTEYPSTAFYPLCRSKAAVDVGWIEGCFDKGASSFVYRRRTGLSKVTFLKVGWVKISQFLPRGLTQGELGKIEPTGVPLEVWTGFGIGKLWFWPRNFFMWSLYQPRILGILRIPQILRTPARASHSTENRIVDDLCSQILLCRALCGATKMSRKMGMALLVKGQPSVPEHKLCQNISWKLMNWVLRSWKV